MSLISAAAIYFIIWWLTLFAVLPWGVRTQEDDKEVVPGSAPSAPSKPMLGKKLFATTIISSAIFVLVYLAITRGWLTLDSFSFIPKYE